MKTVKTLSLLALVAILTALSLGGCQKNKDAGGGSSGKTGGEKAVAPEKNPPGDIPDSQVFITYAPSEGVYSIRVPEGWARSTSGDKTAFTFHFDGVSVTLHRNEKTLTPDTIRSTWAGKIKQNGRAVTIKYVRPVTISGMDGVLLSYESNSEPDPVTGKQIRLENHTYFFFKDGTLAALRLWAPLGADNVDQWRYISKSFRWE